MKNRLLKNSIKEIKDTLKRFISILLMAFLGVGFFSGLVATGPDMEKCLDNYYDKNNVYDISIISTMGLTEDDLVSIKKLDGIEDAYGINSKDKEISINKVDYVAKYIELNSDINNINIVSGRAPQNENECVLDNLFANSNKYEIGSKVHSKEDDKDITVVGLAQSPLYMATSRGNSNIGTGTLNCYIYVNEINQEYFTNIYVRIKGAKDLQTNTDNYNDLVENIKNEIEEIKDNRIKIRYEEIKNTAQNKITDAKEELEKNKIEAQNKIKDAQDTLTENENKISNAKKEVELNKKELQNQKNKASSGFENAEEEIRNQEENLNKAEENIKSAETGLETVKSNISQLQDTLRQLENQKQNLISLGQSTNQIDAQIGGINANVLQLQEKQKQLESEIATGKLKIEEGKNKLQEAKMELEESRKKANNSFASAQAKISNAEKEISENEDKIADGKKELEKQRTETNQKLADAEEKITKSENEINDIKEPIWYIQTRSDNSGYSTFVDSVSSMVNVSKLFPVVFYLIAILTSSTSMTRMVEEERMEIGTLKALGYTNLQILAKYVLYALSACLIGGILGMAIGFKFLPSIIWFLYGMIFNIPGFTAPFRMDIGVAGQGIAILCIIGATILACKQELKNMPAILMRPKAPKSGKRILLEKIKFIWKKLKFSQKVTARNLLRYKKRGIMTIIGIAGCTSLVLAGFGLKDSIIGIVPYQYGNIFTYKEMITINDENNITAIENIINQDESQEETPNIQTQNNNILDNQKEENIQKNKIVQANMKTATADNYNINIITPKDSLEDVINLYDKKTGKKVQLNDDGVIITEKLADLLKIKVGEAIKIQDGDGSEYTFNVSNIVKNYVYNYVYMTSNVFETNIEKYKTNMILVKDELTQNQKKAIIDSENVTSLMDVSSLIERVNQMLVSLNYVVVILIVSAALLAFVVLYNLANINIGERIREIATLKVLGFYNKEVDNYISKETNILTAIGILIGLFGGYILCNFLISTCEMDMVRFIRYINPISYIYAIAITILFTIVVNIIVHHTLKKVDMIESLKSIE